jgi:uncharacterized CHY-type Zn-finger protein
LEYRGIKLADSVKLYKKDGSYNKNVKMSLDSLADLLDENGHELLEEYKSAKDKVLIDFHCGHYPHLIRLDHYKSGHGCSICSGNSPEQAKEEIISLLERNGHIWLEGEYENNNTKILIDFRCGHKSHWITPNSYKSEKGCPKCGDSIISEKLSKQAKEEFPLLVEFNGHDLISEYVGNHTKVLIDFKCGHEPHLITPGHYKSGNGCPKCSGRCPQLVKDEFILLLKDNNHELLSEYNGAREKVLIDFKCKHKPHWVRVDHYKNGVGCPICNESKGERKIREWLEKNNFEFIPQMKYDNLLGLGNGELSYDFYLPRLNILIEYQGQFHDGNVSYQTIDEFEYQKEHDRRKKWYADLHGIVLLEIWYWDFDNIERILQNKLIKLDRNVG